MYPALAVMGRQQHLCSHYVWLLTPITTMAIQLGRLGEVNMDRVSEPWILQELGEEGWRFWNCFRSRSEAISMVMALNGHIVYSGSYLTVGDFRILYWAD